MEKKIVIEKVPGIKSVVTTGELDGELDLMAGVSTHKREVGTR